MGQHRSLQERETDGKGTDHLQAISHRDLDLAFCFSFLLPSVSDMKYVSQVMGLLYIIKQPRTQFDLME